MQQHDYYSNANNETNQVIKVIKLVKLICVNREGWWFEDSLLKAFSDPGCLCSATYTYIYIFSLHVLSNLLLYAKVNKQLK